MDSVGGTGNIRCVAVSQPYMVIWDGYGTIVGGKETSVFL